MDQSLQYLINEELKQGKIVTIQEEENGYYLKVCFPFKGELNQMQKREVFLVQTIKYLISALQPLAWLTDDGVHAPEAEAMWNRNEGDRLTFRHIRNARGVISIALKELEN